MPHGSHNSRILHLVTKTTDAFGVSGWTLNQIDPDGLRHVATMSVRGHWFIIAVLLFELVYRPYLYFGVDRYATYALPILALIGFNGYINYRLLSNRADYMALDSSSLYVGHISNFRSDGVKHRLQPHLLVFVLFSCAGRNGYALHFLLAKHGVGDNDVPRLCGDQPDRGGCE